MEERTVHRNTVNDENTCPVCGRPLSENYPMMAHSGCMSKLHETQAKEALTTRKPHRAVRRMHWVENDDGIVLFVGSQVRALRYYKHHGGAKLGLHLISAIQIGNPKPVVGKKWS